jgi:HK97 family phage prohead protease
MSRPVYKRVPVLHAKALAGGEPTGTFEAVVSIFGNEDDDHDVVEPGAFAESIAKRLPPVVWSHDWLTPPIGATVEMAELSLDELAKLSDVGVPEEATGGLYGKARLLVNRDAGEDVPLARHIYAAMKASNGDGSAVLDEFSWGGTVTAELREDREGAPPLYRLQKAALDEWGPCLKGVNPETALVAVKAEAVHSKVYLSGREIALAIERMAVDKARRRTEKTDAEDLGTLGQMLALGAQYIEEQDEPDDQANIAPMKSALTILSELVGVEAAEDEPTDEPEDEPTTAAASVSVAKGALPVSNLPLAARDRAWDGGAAKARVHGWAEKPGGGYDRAKLEQAYLWRDGGSPADQVTSYRFIVTDLIGGNLTYVPTGIQTAANVLMGGRGGTTIGDSGVAELKASVGRLYARMAREFDDASIVAPWANDGSKSAAADSEQRLAIAGLLLP